MFISRPLTRYVPRATFERRTHCAAPLAADVQSVNSRGGPPVQLMKPLILLFTSFAFATSLAIPASATSAESPLIAALAAAGDPAAAFQQLPDEEQEVTRAAVEALMTEFTETPEAQYTSAEVAVLREALLQGRLVETVSVESDCTGPTDLNDCLMETIENTGYAAPGVEFEVGGTRAILGSRQRTVTITYENAFGLDLWRFATILRWQWETGYIVQASSDPYNAYSRFGWTYNGTILDICVPTSCRQQGSVGTKVTSNYSYSFARFLGAFNRTVAAHVDANHIYGGSLTGYRYVTQ